MKRTLLALAISTALSACSTLNNHGIGGEPRLACMFRDGSAVIDDRILGTDAVHDSLVRRFEDGDALCRALKPIGVDLVSPPAAAAGAAK